MYESIRQRAYAIIGASFIQDRKRANRGGSKKPVPRESVYDTELMRLLRNWLTPYTVSGLWHLVTKPDGRHKYSDIVIQGPLSEAPIVLELLATGDKRFVKEHIERTPLYQRLLTANEAWVIHFTCEGNYAPVWQSDQAIDEGLNVVHISHDLGFTEMFMKARWKDAVGIRHQDDLRIF